MKTAGFTLLELAFVLVIVGLLLAGGLPVAGALIQQNKAVSDRALLSQAQRALVGYAMVRGGLPEPDQGGTLPHGPLGLRTTDSYGKPLRYAVNPVLSESNSAGNLQVFCARAEALVRGDGGSPRICASAGEVCGQSSAVAFILVAGGPNYRADGANADNDDVFANPSHHLAEDYDDSVISYALTQLVADCHGV